MIALSKIRTIRRDDARKEAGRRQADALSMFGPFVVHNLRSVGNTPSPASER